MDDINQLQNPMKSYALMIITASFFLFIFALFSGYQAWSFNSRAVKIEANIESIVYKADSNNKEYVDTLVRYFVNGKEYRNISIGTVIQNAAIGNKIPIFYSINNPAIARHDLKSYSLSIFVLFLSFCFFIASILALKKIKDRAFEIRNLLQEANFIIAKVIKIEKNTSLRIKGRNPYYLVCAYGNNMLYSDNIWIPLQRDVTGEDIKVYCKDESLHTYYIDTRDLYKQ